MSGKPEKWEVNVLGRAPRRSFPRRLRLLPAGTSAFLHSRPAHPAPSARVAWLFYQHGGEGELEEVERGWVGARELFCPLPHVPSFFFHIF